MDARTAQALEESIEHWRENCIAPFESVRIYNDSCALCSLFYGGECYGCPVAQAGFPECIGSPWERAYEARKARREPAFREAASAELAFLESLREPVTADDQQEAE